MSPRPGVGSTNAAKRGSGRREGIRWDGEEHEEGDGDAGVRGHHPCDVMRVINKQVEAGVATL